MLLFFLLSLLHLSAQSRPTSPAIGQHFLIAFPDTLDNKNGGTQLTLGERAELIIYGVAPGSVSIVGPTGSLNVQVQQGGGTVVDLFDIYPPPTSPFIGPSGFADNRVVDVTATVPVWIYCRIINPFGTEMFVPLPVESWGMEYRTLSLRNTILQSLGVDPDTKEEGFEVKQAPGQVIVIASENNTRITLSASLPVLGPRSFTLNARQAVHLPTIPPSNQLDTVARDLTGGLITSDKPIAVISGNTRSGGGKGADRQNVLTGNSARNLLIEWLPPVNLLGRTHLYLPMQTDTIESEEIIRIVATGPGTTTLTSSFDPSSGQIGPGAYADLRSPDWRSGSQPEPFVIEADQPVLAGAISGSWVSYLPNQAAGDGYGTLRSIAPAMTLLPPVESWLTHARFPAFSFPAGIQHYLIIAATEEALVSLDGTELQLDPVPNSLYRWGHIAVEPGEHWVNSSGGTFGGIIYAYGRGYEAFRPLGVKKKEERDPLPMHVAEYEEYLSIAWATPVTGGVADPVEESLDVIVNETCDTVEFVIHRATDNPYRLGPIDIGLTPASTNLQLRIDTLSPTLPATDFSVRVSRADSRADGTGGLRVTTESSDQLYPVNLTVNPLSLPDSIEFSPTDAGSTLQLTLPLRSQRNFPVTLTSVRLKGASDAFTLVSGSSLPRVLENDTIDLRISFSPARSDSVYRDTLLLLTSCGEFAVPIVGVSRSQGPDPTITGYDWQIRSIGSTNDTLSFIGNTGGTPYDIATITIAGGPAGPFSIVPPAPAQTTVTPGLLLSTGIRFAPASPGIYVDTIRLTTEDGDVVTALLRGVALDTSAAVDYRIDSLRLDTICLDDIIDTALSLRNLGARSVQITDLTILRADNIQLIATPNLPLDLGPGETGSVRLLLKGLAPGPFDLLFGVESDAEPEGRLVHLQGVVIECEEPALTVTDHDFGTLWITTEGEGKVWVKNVGRGDVTVTSATIVDESEPVFTYIDPIPPFIVPEGDSVCVMVRFRPMTEGEKQGGVLFETSIGPYRSQLVGRGKKIVIPAFIRRDYVAETGTETAIAIELELPPDSVYPERISYHVDFFEELLDATGVIDQGGLQKPVVGESFIEGDLLRPADSLLQPGVLLRLRFLVRLSLAESSELPFRLESELPWVEFDERPGLIRTIPICGLQERLFDFTQFGLLIGLPEPNPASVSAEFRFEIPFPGLTTLILYDLLGHEVVRVIDNVILPAGAYTYTIPVATLPPGTYILRFRSGTISSTRRLEVRR